MRVARCKDWRFVRNLDVADIGSKIAARPLATYLIPGCVGRGVGLGSESSAPAESGNLETWKSGNLEIWGPGNPEIWRSEDLEIQKLGVQKI